MSHQWSFSTVMEKKVLMADDEADLVITCARFLEQLGYRCLRAYDASRAIELLAREEPDLVITDFQLPDRTGIEIARHIRQTHRRTPVILITAYNEPGLAEAACEAGADVYLTKPFSLGDLAKAADRALGQSQLH